MHVFTARDTGIETMAWSAAQDPTGTLYFGCDTVISFDGDRWRPKAMDPTYLVRGLDVGPNGRIWAGGVNQIGWFDTGTRGEPAYHSLMGRLPAGAAELGDIWRVYAQGDEGAVFVARERVLQWDGRAFRTWDYPGTHLVWSTRTAKGIYVHYPPVGLLKLGAGDPTLVVPAQSLGPAEVRWLDDTGSDWLLLTARGFSALQSGICTPLDTQASAFARANTPTSVARLEDGVLAVGTLQGGIGLVDREGSLLRVFDVKSGLPSNQVYSLFVDRAGALWDMGPASIVRLAMGADCSSYGARSGYPPGGISSLARSGDSLLGVSHSDILRLSPDPDSGGAGRFVPLGIKSSRFYSLLSTPAGLAVGHFHGLGLLSGGGMRPVVGPRDVVFRLSPSVSAPGRLLASLYESVLSVDPDSGASRIVADALPDYGDTVVDEPSGRVWIGTPSRGLFVSGAAGTKAEPAGPRFGPFPAVGPALVARAGPNVVVLANGCAFAMEAGGDRFRQVAGLPSGSPLAISNADSSGAVWAALAPGPGGRTPVLGRIAPGEAGATWIPQSFEGISGIGSLVGLQVVRSADHDELLIEGTESLLRAGPKALAACPPPPRPQIRAWLRTGERLGGTPADGALPYSTQGIHIECSSLDFGMRESERFQMMLGGAEAQWSSPGDSSERDISGLREGDYDFKARLVSDSGVAGEAAELHFSIAPPWWRTSLSRAGFGAFALLGILALLRLRTGALRRRAELLERLVRRRTQELERANAAKSEFVANMSHEIRNPMGGILSSARELSRAPLDPERRQAVATLQSCATFLASLVEDVLDFAAVEAGSYKVSRAPLSPRDVLGNVVQMLQAKADGASLGLTVDPSLPARVMGDAARIQQVLVNFTVNALKFGGRTIVLSARAQGGQLEFAVSDDGDGIPRDEQKNLFVRFSRLKAARNSAVPGTGLGLAVSRVLAERMGGSVGFTTAAGRGSVFFLRIPLVDAARDGNKAPPNVLGARALVVEDIKYNARALGSMLTENGFEVDFAEDGKAALALLSSVPYRVVFLDCDIPRIDGLEVARLHRSSERPGARTLIVATTAYSSPGDHGRCIAAGMDACMAKPITPERLIEVLSELAGPEIRPDAGSAGLDLRLILRPSDGSPEGRDRALASYVAALDEAMDGAAGPHPIPSRPTVSSAAHRVLSLARLVGAQDLARTAADIQDYAGVYTDSELAAEIGKLRRQASDVRSTLARGLGNPPLNPPWAS